MSAAFSFFSCLSLTTSSAFSLARVERAFLNILLFEGRENSWTWTTSDLVPNPDKPPTSLRTTDCVSKGIAANAAVSFDKRSLIFSTISR